MDQLSEDDLYLCRECFKRAVPKLGIQKIRVGARATYTLTNGLITMDKQRDAQ